MPEGFFHGAKFIQTDALPPGWIVARGTDGTWSAHNGAEIVWGHIDEEGRAVLDGREDFKEFRKDLYRGV